MNTSGIRTVTLTPDDWMDYKAIRLEALRLEPTAFASTYEKSRSRPDQDWRHRLENPTCVTLMARAGVRPIGMVVGCQGTMDEDVGVATVHGMYVSADFRRQGIGRSLLGAIIERIAADPGVHTIRLWVSPAHLPAQRLYEAMGFKLVDEAGPRTNAEPGEMALLIMERPARL